MSKNSIEMTQDYLKSRLSYDPETGDFTWLEGKNKGKKAGDKHNQGYWRLYLNGSRHLAHRIAWLYVHGQMPISELDHINGVKTDNRVANLRDCSRPENLWNIGINKVNTSGFKGVYWDKAKGKWMARIRINKKQKFLGYYPTAELAGDRYKAKAREVHGEFYRENI